MQFSKSIRPDEDVDIHPLLRGVRLDGINSPTGTPSITPGISSATLGRPKAAATPRARDAPTGSDPGNSSTAFNAGSNADSSGQASSTAAAAGNSPDGLAEEPLPRPDPTVAAGEATSRRIERQSDRGGSSPGGKEEVKEWEEKKEVAAAVEASNMPPS